MVKKEFRILSAALLALLLAMGACNKNAEQPQPVPDDPVSERELPDVKELVSKAKVVKDIRSSSCIELAGGVQETELSLTLTNGYKENIFIVTADLNRDSIYARVALPSNLKEKPAGEWPRRTLTSIAYSTDLDGGIVLAMINADFWNTSKFTPRGPVHSNGYVISSTFDPMSNKQGISFVSCSSDDKMSIDLSSSYTEASLALPNVTGSGVMLAWDGKQVDNSSWPADDRHPRTAIGYTNDGLVYFFCVDGRDEGVSEGMTYDEMGCFFEALGCERAVNLDGGGSTQLLTRNLATDKFEIRNKPSDGSERGVINAWAIMQKL